MGKDRIGRFVSNVSKLSLIVSSLTKHAGRAIIQHATLPVCYTLPTADSPFVCSHTVEAIELAGFTL